MNGILDAEVVDESTISALMLLAIKATKAHAQSHVVAEGDDDDCDCDCKDCD